MPLMCLLYRRLLKINAEPGDKRLTHSVVGIFWYFSLLSGIAYTLLLLSEHAVPVPVVTGFLGGLLMGMLLHLAEDLCTRKGITPFYPLNETRIVGSIRPCDVFDNRILRFHFYHGTVLFFFLVFLYAVHWTVSGLIAFSILCLGICIASMVRQSDVRIFLPKNNPHDAGEVISA